MQDVQPLVDCYAGEGYDPSIDLTYYKTHYLRPNGSALLRDTSGTAGSGGTVAAEDNRALELHLPDDVEAVHFAVFSITCDRHLDDYDRKHA